MGYVLKIEVQTLEDLIILTNILRRGTELVKEEGIQMDGAVAITQRQELEGEDDDDTG